MPKIQSITAKVGSTAMAVNARSSEKRRSAQAPLCAVRTPTIAGRATSLPLTPTLPLDPRKVPARQKHLFRGRDAEVTYNRASGLNFANNVAPLDEGRNGVEAPAARKCAVDTRMRTEILRFSVRGHR